MHRACCSAGEEGHWGGHLPVLHYGEPSEDVEEEEGGPGHGRKAPATQPFNGACAPQWMPPSNSHPSGADGDGRGRAGRPDISRLGEEAPLAAVEAERRVNVMRIFLRLVGSNVEDEGNLEKLLTDISSEEFAQIAEERGLAGRCGNPMCSSHVHGYKGKSRFKVERAGAELQLHDLTCFCSSRCKENVRRWMQRLGNPYDRLKDSPMSKVLQNALVSHRARQGSSEGKAEAGCAGTLMGSVVEHLQSVKPTTASTGHYTQSVAEQSTAAVEGYVPKANSARQQASSRKHLETNQHQVDRNGMPQIQERTSPSSSTVDVGIDVSENDENKHQSQELQMRGSSAGASCVSEQQTAALDLHPGCEELEEFPRVLDLGPEHGGLQVVDRPYLNVDGGPLQIDLDSTRDGFAGGSDTDSDDGAEGVAYFEMPSPARHESTLSIFGRLYMALDSWVTPSTIQFLHHGLKSPPGDISAVQDFQALQVLSGHMSRALAPVNRRLHVRTTLSSLEKDFARLLATFKFDCPLPCLSAAEWQIIVATVLRGFSLTLLPSLRTAFEGEQASERVEALLRPVGLDRSRFDALGFVFSAERVF
ncbi:unnamed protein product [Ostreobium quekettii]|uniref:RNA polymerase II subunit B1 CTD phosphatase RPAP2 homolog n=1 Tax=Ostreobium quekettii TaxID=121088 RepID=A0A8S1ISR7_9CHLO|nr:unnamed protein product [Ostreobium quekettii]